jgi:hypothetical protein
VILFNKYVLDTAGFREPSNINAVTAVTEARLVNPLTSTSLTSRSRVISALGRYNHKYMFDCVMYKSEMSKLLLDQAVSPPRLQAFAGLDNALSQLVSLKGNELHCTVEDSLTLG